jgi:hypothetical protein
MSQEGYLVVYSRDGKPCLEIHGAIRPHSYHEAFAARLFGCLNRVLSHGGTWSVTWKGLITLTKDDGTLWFGWPTQWVASWFDPDGDLQFEVGNDDPFITVMNANIEDWMDQCEEAYQHWVQHLIDVGVKDCQTIQYAKGERSIDPDDQPPL